MKNIMKKIVAFLCVLTLSVGAMAAWTPAKEVKATETSTDPTPVYLEGYKHITLEDFGISDGVTYSTNKYVQLKDSNGAAVAGVLEDTLISLKVKFTQKDSGSYGSALVIGGNDWNRGFAFRPNRDGKAIGILNLNQDSYPLTEQKLDNKTVNQLGVLYVDDVNTALGTSDFNFYNEFMLQVRFDYTTEGEQTYLTLTFYVNGEQIQVNERLTSASSQARLDFLKMKISSDKANHGTYIGFEELGNGGTLTMSSVVAAEESTGPTPVYLEGYKHVSLDDFGLSEGEIYSGNNKYAQLKDNTGTSVAGTFDKTLLSLKVKFTQKDSNSYGSPLVIGGDDWGKGFAIRVNRDGTAIGILNVNQGTYPMTEQKLNNATVQQVGVLYTTDVNKALGTSDFNFYNEFILQVRFDYTTESEQTYLTLAFYVNGEQIQVNERLTSTSSEPRVDALKMKISSDKKNHGTFIGFDDYETTGGTLTMSSVVPENDELQSITWSDFVATRATGEPVYLDGYDYVTLSNFGMPEGETYSGNNKYAQLKDSNGTAVGRTFDKTLLSLKVKFTQKDSSSYGSPLVIGGDDWGKGFAIRVNRDGTAIGILNVNQKTYPMTEQKLNNETVQQVGVLYTTDVNKALGTSNFNFYNEFILQVRFDYTTEDEQTYLTLTFYVNGEQIQVNERLTSTGSQTRLDFLKMKISSNKANHGTYIGFDDYETTGGTLTMSSVEQPEYVSKATIPNKAFLKSGQKAYVLKESDAITSLDNTSFEGRVTFLSNSDNDVIYYGGGEAGTGLRFSACGENGEQLKLLLGADELNLDATTAGVTSFVDNEFCLKITTEYANYDGDEDSDDVQLGIFINGKLYNNRYLYAYDYTTAGNYVTIDSNEKGIMLRSVTAGLKDVTYNLSQGVYRTIRTDFPSVAKATFGAKEITDFSSGLNESGDYTLFNDAEVNVGEVVLYQAGDVHPDSDTDVRDLVAMMKVNANVALETWAGTMGAYEAEFSETQIIDELLNITEQ